MHTVVIGGGVIGLTTAYHLAREGEAVTLLDARATGKGASEVNAGWFVPAEASPVPGPGVVSMALKSVFHPDSPLYIRPSLAPDFLRFMIGMWRRSNDRDQRAGYLAHMRLAEGSAATLDEYRADGMDFEMHSEGLLMAFKDPELLGHHQHNLDLVRLMHLDPQVLVGDAARDHEPLLADDVHGGIFFPHERHLDPGAMVTAFHARLVAMGAQIVEGAPVEAVEFAGSRVTAVRSGAERFEGDRFVLAAGAWTGPVSRLFGEPLPVRAGKGYCVEVPPIPLRSATNLHDSRVAITPFSDRLRMSGTMELAGLDEQVNQVRVDAILRAPRAWFRGWEPPATAPVGRAGMRPMTPDGMPVIGRLGRLENTYVSSGHGMLGVTLAAGTAAALTELVLRGTLPAVLEPFTPNRFRGGPRPVMAAPAPAPETRH